ncbi:hypothetical protein [Bifidobacterium sp.]
MTEWPGGRITPWAARPLPGRPNRIPADPRKPIIGEYLTRDM